MREIKTMEHEDDGDTNCSWCTWSNLQRIGKGTGRLTNKRKHGYHPDYIIKIDQNTEKSPGDLKRLVVTQNQWDTICGCWCEKLSK